MRQQNDHVNMGFTEQTFPAGTHICLIYNNDESERESVITKYVAAGIKAGEKVACFVDALSPAEFKEKLFENESSIFKAKADDQLCVMTAKEGYFPDDKFDGQLKIKSLQEFYVTCKDEGYTNVRGSGEMMWATRDIPGSTQLIEYEARLNDFLAVCPLTCICQYNANLFDGATILNILKVHPMMIVHGQIVQNPYYIPPEKFLKDYQAARN